MQNALGLAFFLRIYSERKTANVPSGVPIPTLYLDASVLGGYFDEEWEEPTRGLFDQMQRGQWQFFTSAITVAELAHAPARVRDVLSTTFKRLLKNWDGPRCC
jgi:hypothetical protein